MILPPVFARRAVPILMAAFAVASMRAGHAEETAASPHGQDYCANIGSKAADARFAWQAKRLSELDAQIKQRIVELDAKRAEYRAWVLKKAEMMRKANEAMVGIYAHMDPEAAATQLAAMDDDTAAAVLAQLSPRGASAILNEMTPERAASVVNAIAGAKSPGDDKSPAADKKL